MKIGIFGAGNVGTALGDAWQRQNHEILFGLRDPGSAETLVAAGTVEESAQFGDVVVLALPWQAAYELLPSVNLAGKIVVDCTNRRGPLPASLGSASSGVEVLQTRATGAHFVKALNTTGANNLANPTYPTGPLAMFYCGDHADAKQVVHGLIQDAGFEPFNVGPLSNAGLLEAHAELWIWLASRGGLGREFGFSLLRRAHLPS